MFRWYHTHCFRAAEGHGGLVESPLGFKGTSGGQGTQDKTTGRASSDNKVSTVDALTQVSEPKV